MRFTAAALALPALAAAQQQIPLTNQIKAWFGQASVAPVSASVSSAITAAAAAVTEIPNIIPAVPNPVAAGAAKVAAQHVERLTRENRRELLRAGSATATPGLEEWMVFLTGGNSTCRGLCEPAETAWNESVALMVAGASATKPAPHLALLDCEVDGPLCQMWFTSPPSIVHMFLPQPLPDQSRPATQVRYIPVNASDVNAVDIASIHLEEKYLNFKPYDGWLHPFDSRMARSGFNIAAGYFAHYLAKLPSWATMIGMSFMSRSLMGRRMQPNRNAPPR